MRIKSVSLFLIGGIIIGTALFAEDLGLDNNVGWGKGRVVILVFGFFIAALGILTSLFPNQLSLGKIRSLSNTVVLANFFRSYWYIFPVLIFVIFVYIWFASSDSLVNWVSPTRYYADLANSFKRGKLHLLRRPESSLLNLPNPYDPSTRQGVEAPIDYSLYNGKFYLYWGPVPALILLIISPFTHGKVGDLYLVFSFICGIFLWQFLLIIAIWNRFFRDLPRWMLSLSILMIGLTAPWTYMLINEPNGRIYEAAIAGAQFFLIGGILFTVIILQKAFLSSLSLAIIGFLWACAIGTRLVMALPVGFMILMVANRIWKIARPTLPNFALKFISLTAPVLLCLVGIGWYNWARFGSVTETGFLYALAGVNLQKYQNVLFSPIYIIQNLYNYILKPPASIPHFPFLYPTTGLKNELFQFYSLPEVYETSPITGLLFIFPFAIMPIVAPLLKTSRLEKPKQNGFLNWISINLLGVFATAFCFLLIFFWAALRYMGDFMPTLAMLSVLGFWQGYRDLVQKPTQQKVYSVLGIVLAFASILMNLLLSISVKQFGY